MDKWRDALPFKYRDDAIDPSLTEAEARLKRVGHAGMMLKWTRSHLMEINMNSWKKSLHCRRLVRHDKNCEKPNGALAGVAQWIECQPANQIVTGSIPSQDTFLGCGPGPQWRVRERQPHSDISLPFFLPPFPSLKKWRKSLKKIKKKKEKSLMGFSCWWIQYEPKEPHGAKSSLTGCIRRNMVSGLREVRGPSHLVRTCLEHAAEL